MMVGGGGLARELGLKVKEEGINTPKKNVAVAHSRHTGHSDPTKKKPYNPGHPDTQRPGTRRGLRGGGGGARAPGVIRGGSGGARVTPGTRTGQRGVYGGAQVTPGTRSRQRDVGTGKIETVTTFANELRIRRN
jgi:hypothetical protein